MPIPIQDSVVNLNGEILAPEAAKVSVFDRSFLYGDSLYEVARTYRGKLFATQEHLDRLAKSAELCRMVLGQDLAVYAREMERTVETLRAQKRFAGSEVYCRIIVSRGTGRIGFGLECLDTPTQYVIIAQPLEEMTPAIFEKGRKLRVVERLRNDARALDPAMKSGNYLNSLLGYLEARAEDYDDAIFCNADGHVTEGSVFSLGYVKRGIFVTAPLDIGILDSITRKHLLRIAREIGMETREVRFPKERLYDADEILWFSTTKEAYPVLQVDDHIIGNGKPGPYTRKLYDAFVEFAHAEVSSASVQPSGRRRAS